MNRALIGCILVVVMFSIVPLTHSSPPDPTWIGAMHDDADYDDIVGLVTFGATNPEVQNYAQGGRHDPHR